MIEQNLEHVDEMIHYLVTQFKEKPRLYALLESFGLRIQDLENTCFDVQASRLFDNAEGVQVDGFGSIVGEAREGRTDVDYKTAIRARMILNFSHGTIEDILALLVNITGNNRIRLEESYPAGFVAQILDPIDPDYVVPTRIQTLVHSCRAGGVYGIVLFGVLGSFQLDSGPGLDIGLWGGGVA
jgi:hypothetical protein